MSAALAMFAALRSRAGAWLGALGAALAALLAAYAAGRRDGRAVTELSNLRRAERAREMRDEVERDVGRAGDPAGELRRDWRRP